MAADQGKTSNMNALAIVAELRGISIPEAGTTRFRRHTNQLHLERLQDETSVIIIKLKESHQCMIGT